MWKNYNRKQENNKHKILNNYYILGGQGDRYAWEALKEDLKGISSCRRRKQKDSTFHFTLPNNFYFFPMGTFLKTVSLSYISPRMNCLRTILWQISIYVYTCETIITMKIMSLPIILQNFPCAIVIPPPAFPPPHSDPGDHGPVLTGYFYVSWNFIILSSFLYIYLKPCISFEIFITHILICTSFK